MLLMNVLIMFSPVFISKMFIGASLETVGLLHAGMGAGAGCSPTEGVVAVPESPGPPETTDTASPSTGEASAAADETLPDKRRMQIEIQFDTMRQVCTSETACIVHPILFLHQL